MDLKEVKIISNERRPVVKASRSSGKVKKTSARGLEGIGSMKQ